MLDSCVILLTFIFWNFLYITATGDTDMTPLVCVNYELLFMTTKFIYQVALPGSLNPMGVVPVHLAGLMKQWSLQLIVCVLLDQIEIG